MKALAFYKLMIRLQIAVSNLKSNYNQYDKVDEISLKFGSITTTLQLQDGNGGKSLFLKFAQAEMLEIYKYYACGLFFQTQSDRYFSLLSLQELNLADRVVCQEIYFLNDSRENKFRGEFSIAAIAYNSPKMPQINRYQERENALNLMKKPAVPKQQTSYNNFVPSEENKVPNSFLYGNRLSKTQNTFNAKTDSLKTLKEGLRKQNELKNHLQKSKNKIPRKSQQIMSKRPGIKYEEVQDLFVEQPPMMEFTNDQQANSELPLRVPQIQYIQYADSHDQRKNTKLSSTQPKFATFNRNESASKQRNSPQTPSEFQLVKTQNINLPPKHKTMSKEQIKKLAKKEAEEKEIKDNVMVPIVKGDKFELVPLSKLKPQQIIQYVQRQRKNEEQAAEIRLKKQKLEQQQREMHQRSKKLQLQMQKREKQRISMERQAIQKKKNSLQSKQSYTGLIKEQKQSQNDEESQLNNENEDEYISDFESMTGSVIKSRISSRGGNYKNNSKEEESAGLEDEYSQEFDSYSHSALSKTNLNRNKVASVSDYSDSYRSISQSYGKH